MANILIYNSGFFELSETFIYNQVKALGETNSIYLACHVIKNKDAFPLSFNVKDCIVLNATPINFFERIHHLLNRIVSRTNYRLPPSSEQLLTKFIKKNKIEIVHAHFGPNGVKIIPLAERMKLSLVTSFHGYDASKALRESNYSESLHKLFKSAKKVIVCAKFMKDKLLPFGLQLNQTEVIPYGVDLNYIETVQATENNEITIIHAGRIASKKGVPDLLNVVCKIKEMYPELNFHFKVIGIGTELVELQRMVYEKKVSSFVKLLGAKTHKELLSELKGADVFVLNSRVDKEGDSEGFPNGILEAMACRTAVVSTYHAGIPDVVLNEVNGLLVAERDNDALLEAISSLLLNEEKRNLFTKQAFKDISSRYSIGAMNKRIISVFKNLK